MLQLSVLLLVTALAHDAPSAVPLHDLNKEQLLDLKAALHEMNLDTIFDKQEAITMCETKRKQALKAVNRTHGELEDAADWNIGFSSLTNAVPEEMGGLVVGVGGDYVDIKEYCWDCQSRYNNALDFKKLIDFQKYFSDIQARLHGDESICSHIDETKQEYVNEVIKEAVRYANNKILARIQETMVQNAMKKSMGADAFKSAEEIAADEFWHEPYSSVAEREAAEASEKELINRCGGEVTAESARMIEREAAKRAAQTTTGWVPFAGSVTNAVIGATMMRSSLHDVNDQYQEEYTEGVNKFFDAAEEFMTQAHSIFLKKMMAYVDDALKALKHL